MSTPIIISTWSFSEPIINEAYPLLEKTMSALDAVEQCAKRAELDESIDSVGVCGIERHLHPVSIARLVMEKTEHKMLIGPLADEFADSHGLQSENILSDQAKAKWERWKQSNQDATSPAPYDHGHGEIFGSHDTIGTLAIDASGMMAGSCSTSGMAWKVPGRVGDSPIIGHGLYVDPLRGAATATGHGELISGVCGSFLIVELMGRGASPQAAIHETLSRVASSYELTQQHQTAFIALTPEGEHAGGALRNGFNYAVCSADVKGVFKPDVVLHAATT